MSNEARQEILGSIATHLAASVPFDAREQPVNQPVVALAKVKSQTPSRKSSARCKKQRSVLSASPYPTHPNSSA
jgi:hypothetical protein